MIWRKRNIFLSQGEETHTKRVPECLRLRNLVTIFISLNNFQKEHKQERHGWNVPPFNCPSLGKQYKKDAPWGKIGNARYEHTSLFYEFEHWSILVFISNLLHGSDLALLVDEQKFKLGGWEMFVDVSYAAPQAHRIVNVALHREYSPGIVFV
jgi:hypothetical protein